MANETNLSVAFIEPRKGNFKGVKSVYEQVANVAQAKPDLIVIPRFTYDSEIIREAYNAARSIKPDIALFSQTRHAQKIDSYAPVNNNPLQGLEYAVKDFPHKGIEGLNLHLLVIFGGERIEPETTAITSVRPGGYMMLVDNHGKHQIFYRHQVDRAIQKSPVATSLDKKIKNCSWYDLKF
jgi:hypothetical protein